jgi:hypothetical protein
MPTDEFIIRLFVMIDEELGDVKKHSQAKLYPSEVVTLQILFSLKGGYYRAFYRWILYNHRKLFPNAPHYSRLLRLFKAHASLCTRFLAALTTLCIIDTFGIELLHPRREGRSEAPLGRKGTSNGRWIIGVKLALLINQRGEVVDWCWDTANEHDNTFRDLALEYKDEAVAFSDLGFRKQGVLSENFHYCHKNERARRWKPGQEGWSFLLGDGMTFGTPPPPARHGVLAWSIDARGTSITGSRASTGP